MNQDQAVKMDGDTPTSAASSSWITSVVTSATDPHAKPSGAMEAAAVAAANAANAAGVPTAQGYQAQAHSYYGQQSHAYTSYSSPEQKAAW